MKRSTKNETSTTTNEVEESLSPSETTTATATSKQEEPYRICSNFLNTKAKDILTIKSHRPFIKLDQHTQLYDALEKMSYERILSLPVFDKEKFIGFLDVLDILQYTLNYKKEGQSFDSLDEKADTDFSSIPIGTLLTHRNTSAIVVHESTPLITVLSHLKTAHRVLVVEDNHKTSSHSTTHSLSNKPVGVITQSDIIKLLYHNNHFLDNVALVALSETDIPKSVKVTLPITTPIHVAFQRLLDDRLSAVPITSVVPQVKLMCNLSASDIRGIGVLFPFKSLSYSVEKFFLKFRDSLRPPVTCSLKNWLVMVITKMVLFGIHRVWVVDSEEYVTHVVTMSDIINYLWSSLDGDIEQEQQKTESKKE